MSEVVVKDAIRLKDVVVSMIPLEGARQRERGAWRQGPKCGLASSSSRTRWVLAAVTPRTEVMLELAMAVD